MANQKISQLNDDATPQAIDVLPIVDISGNETKKVTLANLMNILSSVLKIKDSSDTTKKVAFDVSGVTTATTRILKIPNENATIVGDTATQILTNKTIGTGTKINTSGGDGTGAMYYRDSSGNLTHFDIGTNGQIINVDSNGLPSWVANPNDPTLAPKGMISPYAGLSSPTGWLLCDGSAVSRTTYASLFSICSTNYGVGDNSTTFNLPNLKNRIPIGLDTSVKVVIDNCDAAWTAGANVTATNDTGDKKEGTASVKLAVGSSATAGQILGYKAISSLNLAGKSTVGMWIKSDINLSSGDLKYQMDDTAALASPLESINIPALVANVWTKIYIPLANSGNDTAIISQGIYQTNDVGAFNLWVDDINEGENYELGATGGEKTHQLTISELAAHTHPPLSPLTSFTGQINGGPTLQSSSGYGNAATTGSTGGDTAHNNLQPYITINYIIKY